MQKLADIVDRIESYAATDKIAYEFRDSVLSFKELQCKSNALAAFIRENMGDDSNPIIIFGHKDILMPVCFLACAKSGHPYIPVDASTPAGRVQDIIEQSNPDAIFDLMDGIKNPPASLYLGKNQLEAILEEYSGKKPDPHFRNKGEDVYYIIFTSGSTGKPKGVQITYSCLESFINWLMQYLDEDDRVFLNQAPFSFDLSVMDTYLSLTSGAVLYSIDKDMILDLPELFSYFKSSGITTWVSTPSFADMCLQSANFNKELLPGLRKMFFCGETLPKECTIKLFERFPGVRIFNSYGPTEATVAVTAVEITKKITEEDGELPVGFVKEGCEIFINEQNSEIEIVGDSVALGYLGAPDKTQEKFFIQELNGKPSRGYRTGDTGYFKHGLLYYGGRLDNQVKLHGYRIEIEDIESNIRKLPFIDHAVIIPEKTADVISSLTAVVVVDESFEGSVAISVKNGLKKLLPSYMIPRKIIVKKTMPMNTNGKIDRKALMEELYGSIH